MIQKKQTQQAKFFLCFFAVLLIVISPLVTSYVSFFSIHSSQSHHFLSHTSLLFAVDDFDHASDTHNHDVPHVHILHCKYCDLLHHFLFSLHISPLFSRILGLDIKIELFQYPFVSDLFYWSTLSRAPPALL